MKKVVDGLAIRRALGCYWANRAWGIAHKRKITGSPSRRYNGYGAAITGVRFVRGRR